MCLKGDEARIQGFHPFGQSCDGDFDTREPLFKFDGFRVLFGRGGRLVSAGMATVPHAALL
jgi:hypothetical protein